MNTWLKVGLIGGGAYLVYEYFFASSAAANSAPGSTSQLVSQTAAAPATAAATVRFSNYPGVTTLSSLSTAIQALAANDPSLVNGQMPTGDHWNYYANEITGLTLPAAWPSGALTFAQYWAAESPVIAAQTGLGSIWDGLGALVNKQRSGMGTYIAQGVQDAFASPAQGPMSPFFFDADTVQRSWN